MNCRTARFALLPILLQAGLGFGADLGGHSVDGVGQLKVASGTLLRVEVTQRSRLRKGAPLQGRLLEPIYADNRLLVPSGAVLQGKIVNLRSAGHGKRLDAKFHGDFTPLREPLIEWTALKRGDGEQFALAGESTSGPGGTLYFRTTPAQHVSLMRRAWNSFVGRKEDAIHSVAAPRKGERLKKYFWSQMPLHPQYLEDGTQYEMTLTEDMLLPAGLAPAPFVAAPFAANETPLPNSIWVHSRLCGDLDSATAKVGDPVEAVVTQPVVDDRNQLVLPQNSVLHGKVTRVLASGRFGHNGMLRFTFDQVSLPSGVLEDMQGTPMALESNAANRLSIDSEGGVAPKTEHGVAAPLMMGLLSASALTDDEASVGTATVSSNGFAILGRVVGLTTGSPIVGGTIGALGTSRNVYHHWLAHGKDTHFGRDTEVVVEMAPAHGTRISAEK